MTINKRKYYLAYIEQQTSNVKLYYVGNADDFGSYIVNVNVRYAKRLTIDGCHALKQRYVDTDFMFEDSP